MCESGTSRRCSDWKWRFVVFSIVMLAALLVS
jgi:hypothetical protein